MAEYDHQIIRQLLTDAFDAGEVATLAFDLFADVYGNFAPGMTKGQMILAIVEHATRYNRVPDLLNYVKEKNAYQYDRYASRLKPISQISSQESVAMISYQEQRLRDIQHHIEEEMKLLRQYEALLRRETDPRRLMAHESEIDRQRESLAKYQQEAASLSAAIHQSDNIVVTEVQGTLKAMDEKLDALSQQVADAESRLAAGQQAIRDDIAQQQRAILEHIDARHRDTVQTLLQQMDTDQLALLRKLEIAAAQRKISRREAKELAHQVELALEEVAQIRAAQPDAAQWEGFLALLEQETSWEQKLKLTLPLVPGILAFESEMAVDVKRSLKEAWQRLAGRVTGKDPAGAEAAE
jgi:hypothetical protein